MSSGITFSLNNSTSDTLATYVFIGTNSGADIDVLVGTGLAAGSSTSNDNYVIESRETTTFILVFSTQYGYYQTNGCSFNISSSSSVTLVSGWLFGSQGDYQLIIGYTYDGKNYYSDSFDCFPVTANVGLAAAAPAPAPARPKPASASASAS